MGFCAVGESSWGPLAQVLREESLPLAEGMGLLGSAQAGYGCSCGLVPAQNSALCPYAMLDNPAWVAYRGLSLQAGSLLVPGL